MRNRRNGRGNQFESGHCPAHCDGPLKENCGKCGRRHGRKLRRNQATYLTKGEHGKLSQLQIGQRAQVLSLRCDNEALRRRLLDMGITNGVELSIKKIAPLGDPINIKLRGYELCIRKSDMDNIVVEVM